MGQLFQGDLDLNTSISIGNDTNIHKVKYQLQVSDTEFVTRTVKNDNGETDGLFSFGMASTIAEKIRKNVDNAMNITVTKKGVSNNGVDDFGNEVFEVLWKGRDTATGSMTDVTGQ